jgi:hypothetical protein
MNTPATALFMLGHDGYVRPSYNFAKTLAVEGHRTTIINTDINGKYLTDRQIGCCKDVITMKEKDAAEFIKSSRFEYIFLGYGGNKLRSKILQLNECSPQSKIISFFPGLNRYMNFHGCISRYRSDAILFNCRKDLAYYQKICSNFGGDSSNGIVIGYPQIHEIESKKAITNLRNVKNVTYFDQNIFPSTVTERNYLLNLLCRLAKDHPSINLTIQLRNESREVSAHPSRISLHNIAARKKDIPSNIRISSLDYEKQIANTDIAIGISSTALIECIARGTLTYSISDFGIREEYGNSYFINSGILRSVSSLLTEDPVYPTASWIAEYASSYESSFSDFIKKDLRKRDQHIPQMIAAFEQQELFRIKHHGRSLPKKFLGSLNRILGLR